MRVLFWVGIFATLFPLSAFADKELPPCPYVVTASRGMYYFKMVPEGDMEAGGKGSVYAVDREADRLLYETSGWYSHQVFLSNDSFNLCRVGNWGRIGEWYFKEQGLDYRAPDKRIAHSPQEHVALAFYRKGEPIKVYTVADLVPDLTKLSFSVSHYSFLKERVRYYEEYLSKEQKQALNTQDSHAGWVIARTIDGETHVFDMGTGEKAGGEELARALEMTEDDGEAIAAAFLQQQGAGWSPPVNCEHVGDFKYSFVCKREEKIYEVIVDRRSGKASLRDSQR